MRSRCGAWRILLSPCHARDLLASGRASAFSLTFVLKAVRIQDKSKTQSAQRRLRARRRQHEKFLNRPTPFIAPFPLAFASGTDIFSGGSASSHANYGFALAGRHSKLCGLCDLCVESLSD